MINIYSENSGMTQKWVREIYVNWRWAFSEAHEAKREYSAIA
jgi:hypothetical protein